MAYPREDQDTRPEWLKQAERLEKQLVESGALPPQMEAPSPVSERFGKLVDYFSNKETRPKNIFGLMDAGAKVTEAVTEAGRVKGEPVYFDPSMMSAIGALKKTGIASSKLHEFYDSFLKAIKSASPEKVKSISNDLEDPIKMRFWKKLATDYGWTPKKHAPRDYVGSHTAPSPDYGSPAFDLTFGDIYPDDVYSSKAVKFYGTGYSAMDTQAYNVIQNLKNHPNRQVKIFRAVPKDSKIKEINPGDFVTTVRDYAKIHGESTLNGDFKILSKTVTARDIWTDGNSWLEFGYHPQEFLPEISSLRKKLDRLSDKTPNKVEEIVNDYRKNGRTENND